MKERFFKTVIEDKIFFVPKIKFEYELVEGDGFISEKNIGVNYNVSVEEFVAEVERQKEIVRKYLEEKKAFVESHKGKVLRQISQRDVAFLNFSLEDILVLDEEVSIEDAKDKHCLKEFKLEPDKIYRGIVFLKVDAESIERNYVKVHETSYSVGTVSWKEPSECWFKEQAIKLAIYNKITQIFDDCSDLPEYFEMLKAGDMTMKGFIARFDISKKEKRV